MTASPDGLDASVPSAPRVYDALLDGKDNYASDRDLAARLEAEAGGEASVRNLARINRGFILAATTRAVSQGIRQIAEMGAGLPRDPSVHATARKGDRLARVLYVDRDAVTLCHLAALYQAPGVAVLGADVTDTASVLDSGAWREVIDPAEPLLLLFGGTLSAMDARTARATVAGYAAELAPGSRVAVACASYRDPALGARMASLFGPAGYWVHHDRAAIASFFDAGKLVAEDGGQPLVTDLRWWPALEDRGAAAAMLGGVGVKP